MDASQRAQILKLLDEHRIMSLATIRPDGWPQATTVGYVNDGLDIYFLCGCDSQKATNLARDPRVSLTIDHDVPNPMQITGLSMAARAVPVKDEAAIRWMVTEMLPRKYPEYVGMMKDVDLAGLVVFRVAPEVVSVLDYSKGFAHTDLVTIDKSDRPAA